MKHRNCLGDVKEYWGKTYEYEGEEFPAYFCEKCGEEFLGDAEILLDYEEENV